MAVKLSVLIPTLVRREAVFLPLLHVLAPQCRPGLVEVVALQNQGEELLEYYRERLLQDARGEYLAFVDDDDEVAPYYVQDILEALESGPDMVAWQHLNSGTLGAFTNVNLRNDPERQGYGVARGGYWRRFTHTSPVRTELARQGTFMSDGPGYTGEDMVFVSSVLPYLHTQAELKRPVYHYRWSPHDSTQRGRQPPPVPHQRPDLSYLRFFRWCE